MGFIYKITNKENGKIYVGQTVNTINRRWKQHLRSAQMNGKNDSSPLLYRAIRKYGVDSFEIEQVEQCNNHSLNEREIYWIDYYHSFDNGYNCTHGGSGIPKVDEVKLLELWNAGLSVKQIAKRMGCLYVTVSSNLKGLGIKEDDIVKRATVTASKTKCNPICQYDIDGNFVREFQSCKDATRYIGCKIKQTPCKAGKTIHGYQWKHYKTDKIESIREELESVKSSRKRVYQYDMNGKYIASYNSIVEAEMKFGRKYGSAICIACKGKIPSAYGYRWSKEKYEVLQKGVSF